jgi:hypothetical protein
VCWLAGKLLVLCTELCTNWAQGESCAQTAFVVRH